MTISLSLDLVRETFVNPPVYIAESEASWLYTPVDNLSGLPRHDDMADVVAKPAEHIFIFHEEYQLGGISFHCLTNSWSLYRRRFYRLSASSFGLDR